MNNNNNNYLFVLEISKGNICTAIFFTFTQEFKIILSFIFLGSKETNNMKYTLHFSSLKRENKNGKHAQ